VIEVIGTSTMGRALVLRVDLPCQASARLGVRVSRRAAVRMAGSAPRGAGGPPP
jgi:hypothetical protein